VRSIPHLAPPHREGDCPKPRPNAKEAADASDVQPDGGHTPCAIPSSRIPGKLGVHDRTEGCIRLHKLSERWDVVQRRLWVGALPAGARMQGMGPCLQDTMTDATGAMNSPPNVEPLVIRPQGRMASDAATEPREGGGTHPGLRQPRPAFMGRGLERLVPGVQQIQEAVTAVRGVLKQLAPVFGSLNVGTMKQEVARCPWAPAHGNLERHDGIVSSLLGTPLHTGGHKPEVNRALRIPSKPGPHSTT
jgi:hypothetical protein